MTTPITSGEPSTLATAAGRPTLVPALHGAAWLALACSVLAFGVWLGPTINQDSLFGLLAARDHQAGAPWNHLRFPDLQDVARDRSAFLAWWAPAQWLVPAAWGLAGIPLGWSLVLTTATALVAGMIGLSRLYRELGYTESEIGWSLLVLGTSVHVWRRSAEYHGGEVLLFGLLPWLVLAARRIGLGMAAMWQLPLLLLLGSFVKLSFAITALAIIVMLWWSQHGVAPRARAALRDAAFAILVFCGYYAAFTFIYASRGVTPDAIPGAAQFAQLPLMAAGPLSFIVAGETVAGRFLPAEGSVPAVVALAAAIAAAVVLTVLAAWRAPTRDARVTLVAFALINVSAIAFLYWRGHRVWFIDRIFMPAGLVLLPALVHLARVDRPRCAAWSVRLLLAFATVFSVGHAVRLHGWQRRETAGSAQHIRHVAARPADLRQLAQIVAAGPPGALAVFTDPSIASLALEWPGWRAFVPSYSAIHDRALVHGGPATWSGRPAAILLVSLVDSPAEQQAGAMRPRLTDLQAAPWRHVSLGRITLWTTLP